MNYYDCTVFYLQDLNPGALENQKPQCLYQ
jgi:hypothetical protein